MDLSLTGHRREGQLKKPQKLLDLMGGAFVAYQGQRRGSLPHTVVVYVKRENSTQVIELVDIPEDAVFHQAPVNSYSPPEGFWVLASGHKGVPTVAEQLMNIMPGVYAKLADHKMLEEAAEVKARIAQNRSLQSQDEMIHAAAEQSKTLKESVSPGLPYDPRQRKPNVT